MSTNIFYRDFPEEYIIDLIYPIGSIYMSVENTNPRDLFKGTKWEQIEDKFLAASGTTITANTNGSASKNYSVTGIIEDYELTEDEIPSHAHNIAYHTHNSNGVYNTELDSGHKHTANNLAILVQHSSGDGQATIEVRRNSRVSTCGENSGGTGDRQNGIAETGSHVHTISGYSGKSSADTESVGKGEGHSHPFTISGQTTIDTLPPYLAVYMWKRIE